MKAFLPLEVAACCAAAFFGHLATHTANAQVRLAPRSYAGGLVISLTTNGYKFAVPPADGAALPEDGPPVRQRESFSASVLLSNRSNSDITFTFPDANAAAAHFAFRVLNDADDVIWQSDPPTLSPVAEIPATLGKRRTWQRTVQVPLKTNDTTWLAPGRYTLEAFVNGKPTPAASTFFEVVLRELPPPPPPEDNQGIEGVVFQQSNIIGFSVPPTLFPPLPVKANYTIEEIVPPNMDRVGFVWTGVTDDQGRFHVMTPPGLFKVTATRAPQPGDPTSPPPSATIEVRVNAGAFTKVTIYLPPINTVPPPPADSGIRGLVLAPPGGPLAAQPLPDAPVTVDEITDVVVGRPRFHWTGKTDANGRFQVATYPGRYRVTAVQLGIFKGTAEVTVKEHAYTDMELVIENTLVGAAAQQPRTAAIRPPGADSLLAFYLPRHHHEKQLLGPAQNHQRRRNADLQGSQAFV